MRLARRTDPVLGEHWDLARDGEQGDEIPDVAARFAGGGIALSADAARALRGEPGPAPEGRTSVELAPGVRMLPVRTPTLPPATHTNLFVIGERDAVLVEPATPHEDELDRVVGWLRALEREGVRPRAMLLTHHHPDHVGGARALAEALSLGVEAHPETTARLAPNIPVSRALTDGARIDLGTLSLRALHTPGHAPGHLCFVEERSRVMIAGDMVAGTGTILVEPGDGDMALYLASLRRMADAEPSVLAPAHGGALRPAVAVLERYLAHRLERERKILEALRSFARGAAAGEVVPIAYADAPVSVWPIARLSTEAHLVKLEREGHARRDGERWVASR